jgi:LysR family transcriptional regulator, glycine cleavage system transcriptional activator
MSRKLPPLSSLRAFESAARLRSFKEAAAELSVTATAISHRIRVLEDHLGRALFLRKVRAVELTPDGVELFTAVSSGFGAIHAGIERLRKPPRASVMLSATPAFATKWLIPRLASFQAQHPEIDLHVHASNQPVDLNAGAADLAVRYGHGYYKGATSTLLLHDRFAPVSSPALRAKNKADIARQTLIHFDWHRPPPVDLRWAGWMQAARIARPNLASGIRYSEESHAIQAAIASQGIALVSLLLVQQELELGLLKVVPGPILEGLSYHLVTSKSRALSPAAAKVKDWLLGQAQKASGETPRPSKKSKAQR